MREWWREKGLDLRLIQILLKRSTLLVTQRYLNLNDDELTEAMEEKMWKRAREIVPLSSRLNSQKIREPPTHQLC